MCAFEGLTVVDGAYLEGGGQIARISTCLSAILKVPIRLINIRRGRKVPGLRPQHLAGLVALQDIAKAQVDGAYVKSETVNFIPSQAVAGSYNASVGTAGACTLIVQSVLPALLFAAPGPRGALLSDIKITGGTDVPFAPTVQFVVDVVLPNLSRVTRQRMDLDVVQHGYMPKGGGEVILSVDKVPTGATLPAINLMDRGELISVNIKAYTANRVPTKVATSLVQSAASVLAPYLKQTGTDVRITESITHVDALDNFAALLVTTGWSSGIVLGWQEINDKRDNPEKQGQLAGEGMVQLMECGACADEWMQDQYLIFMGLAAGRSQVLCQELSDHSRTAIKVVEQLTGAQYRVQPVDNGVVISCEGAGVQGL